MCLRITYKHSIYINIFIMSQTTVESVQEQIKTLQSGDTLLVRALKTKSPDKN